LGHHAYHARSEPSPTACLPGNPERPDHSRHHQAEPHHSTSGLAAYRSLFAVTVISYQLAALGRAAERCGLAELTRDTVAVAGDWRG
jgi:hypothetical protein